MKETIRPQESGGVKDVERKIATANFKLYKGIGYKIEGVCVAIGGSLGESE